MISCTASMFALQQPYNDKILGDLRFPQKKPLEVLIHILLGDPGLQESVICTRARVQRSA